MAYQPSIKVAGTWRKITINWTEVIGGPSILSDLTEDTTSRHLSDTMITAYSRYASSTLSGDVKMRVDGTDVYIRNDGTDA